MFNGTRLRYLQNSWTNFYLNEKGRKMTKFDEKSCLDFFVGKCFELKIFWLLKLSICVSVVCLSSSKVGQEWIKKRNLLRNGLGLEKKCARIGLCASQVKWG